MDDQRTAEGLEHLQAAANELLAAARSFLDVAEDVISDPERFGGIAAGAVELVKNLGGRTEQPWERSAWDVGAENKADSGGASSRVADDGPDVEAVADSDDPDQDGEPDATTGPKIDAPAPKVAKKSSSPRPRKKAAASKVKRIAVD